MASQFAKARAVQPFVRTGRLQRRARKTAGPGWALLPHAAYFLDALFSSGNAHTSLGIERLALAFERHWGRPTLARELERYARALFREVDFVDRLVDGCYRCFGRFEALAAWVMYYFAGAIHAEEARRGGPEGAVGFLASELPLLRAAVERDYERLPELIADPKRLPAFEREVARTIAPINVGGLCDPAKLNLYPFVQAG
jgi:FADH2 O2-dependent halogenase